ncbi:MAG: sigma-54 dependent transcriptional regulator [Sterolibacteriaceae bacterium MAG5]|nr:sigma-54 dependent transcriptional regulator [Candidatus Nitricoxidireducens bremensis]
MTPAPAVDSPAELEEAFGPWHQYSALVVDDEPGMRSFLTRALSSRCGHVEAAANIEEAARLIDARHFDLIVLDNMMPGTTGLAWLQHMREAGLHSEVILITAFADLEMAIQALRAGAADFILKPFRINQILNAIGRCFDRARLQRENFVLRRELTSCGAPEFEGDGLVGDSSAIRNIRAVVQRLAPLPTTVLITGESGTGKEVTARALHNLSPRAASPFVPVNCGAIAPELMESELFGHLKGAFSGAASSREGLFFYAQGGTLFLDEVGELPPALQTKLLRVIEDKKIRPVGAEREIPVDVRILAATNRDLAQEVAVGRFRQDLYYRLNVMNLHIPPLRERREDIEPLARHFLRLVAAQLNMASADIEPAALERMGAYAWPGNARELRNVVERFLILGTFPAGCMADDRTAEPAEADLPLEEIEKRHILRTLSACGHNKAEAARRLGVSRKTLDRKCAEWGA